jgi:phosphoribosylanthranilate isomerase
MNAPRENPQVKVCGITRTEDAVLAAELGAFALGFIFYPQSPRAITFEKFNRLRGSLPAIPRVYVQVRPEAEEIRAALTEGFDAFQLHFSPAKDLSWAEEASAIIGADRLWLAPKIAPGESFPVGLLSLADTFLLDTYREDQYGGTGETGDWGRFSEWKAEWPEKRWILAGGLKSTNVGAALGATSAAFIDVSSGVEQSPGVKAPALLRSFFKDLPSPR